jgi:hypothetical protein
MGDVTTSTGTTTSANPDVQPTVSMLLKGLQDAYKGGVDVYDKSLYTPPSDATKSAWGAGTNFANSLIGSGGFNEQQNRAMGTLGGVTQDYGRLGDNGGLNGAQTTAQGRLGNVYGGYGQLGDNGGLSAAQAKIMGGVRGLGGDYAALSGAYEQNAPGYQRLRSKLRNDTATGIYKDFNNSGLFGSDANMRSAGEGIADSLAGLDYGNYQNNVNNKYRSLDSQRGVYGDAFSMGQTGVGNQFGALAGRAGTANSMFGNAQTGIGNQFGALAGQAGAAGTMFGMGQQGINNQTGAIGTLAGIGAAQDADSLAGRMADADLFDRTNNKDWNTLARTSSILGGTAGAGGSSTSNSVPWWSALLGGAATGASIFG